ncbi:MAG TPA: SRPBCC family protein [Bordetella sp.]|nr:SRPBCC family protein [Bordetella sp.]
MQLMSLTTRIDHPADQVWSIVSDFGGLKRWNPAVTTCSLEGAGVGAQRTFQAGPATVCERIEALDQANRSISYSIVSGSSIKARDGRLTISVKPLGASACELTWSMQGEPDGVPAEELRQALDKRYSGRIEDLRRVLAAGG